MTRLLKGKSIPKKVLTPANRNMDAESRHATVYGVSVLPKCLNKDCEQQGPFDALILGPFNIWPNIAVLCGPEGCGIHWTMIGTPPLETMWIQVDDESE